MHGGKAESIGIIPEYPRGQGPGHREIAHAGDLADDRLCVHGIVEGLAHAPIVEGFALRVKPGVDEVEYRYTDSLILPVLRVGSNFVDLPAGNNRLFQIPPQELGKCLLKLATHDNFKHDGVQKGPALIVVLIGLQHDLLFGSHRTNLNGPVPTGARPKRSPSFSTSS